LKPCLNHLSNHAMKLLFLLVSLWVSVAIVKATDQEGYIIRIAADTVRGKVDVPFKRPC
jgi:hypothetical protein